MKDKYQLKLQCVFCGSKEFFQPEKDYIPAVGEQIKCAKCGKLNDYEALCGLAVKENIGLIKTDFNNEVKKIFKKSGFKLK